MPRLVAGAQAEPNDPSRLSPRSVVDFGSMPFVSPPWRGCEAQRAGNCFLLLKEYIRGYLPGYYPKTSPGVKTRVIGVITREIGPAP